MSDLSHDQDETEEILECSSDILENLSRMRGICLVCGRVVGGNLIPEIQEGWTECVCGNAVFCINTNKWH